MSEEFDLKAAGEQTLPDGSARKGACPLALIPPRAWRRLFREPFRARHPFIFWIGALILPFIAGGALFAFFSDRDRPDSENCLALVNIQGAILNPEPALAWIRKIEGMEGVKGILLRVDSPGGGAAASQEIYAALARAGEKKPIAVSMGSMAASGGLMASMAGWRIFANPSTVTGSIGVRMDIPQVQGLMDKIGVGQETLVTAPFKDAASYLHPLSQEARAYLQGVIMNMHDQFVAIVAKGRKMDLEKARGLASGKIFTGEQALSLGLIDELGGQYEAHQWLSEKTGVPREQALLKRKNPQKGWVDLLMGAASALGFDAGLAQRLGLRAGAPQPVFLYQF